MQPITITATDGYRLSALYAAAPSEPTGSIILSSATGVKKEFYLNFAKFLVQKGYNILLFDYRGIGGSAPADLKSSKAFMHEWGTKDMNAALDFMVAEKGLTNIIWLGHSIGGQLMGFLQNRQHIKKVITVNAAVGYWGYFPFPMNIKIWAMWHIIGPLLIKFYGYGPMQKIGWGEDLPKNIILEWRQWCLNKKYFVHCLEEKLKIDKFYQFKTPITAVYTSDDFIATDKTIALMMKFFPNAPVEILKIPADMYTQHKSGHTGLFRKRFEKNLWPLLANAIESPSISPTQGHRKKTTRRVIAMPLLH